MRVLLSHPLKWCYIFYFLAAEVLLPTGSAFDLVISKGAQAEIPLLATSYSLYNFSESYFETELALKGVEVSAILLRDVVVKKYPLCLCRICLGSCTEIMAELSTPLLKQCCLVLWIFTTIPTPR